MRSTAEWEAALEGTTEGNWIQAQGVEVWAEGDNGVNLYVGSAYQHTESREDNARLVALAPEAVAEVVRLRKVIEDRIRLLRLPLCSHMPEGDELDDLAEQWGRQSYEAEVLTRILEGNDG